MCVTRTQIQPSNLHVQNSWRLILRELNKTRNMDINNALYIYNTIQQSEFAMTRYCIYNTT
jgi:hypothetical protein